jgi:hypothetical protein
MYREEQTLCESYVMVYETNESRDAASASQSPPQSLDKGEYGDK